MADIKMPLIEIPGLGGPVVYLEDAEAAIQAAVTAEREACEAECARWQNPLLIRNAIRARGAAHD